MPPLIILLLIGLCVTFDGSGNDIEEEISESIKAPITINAVNSLLRPYGNNLLNVSLQLEFVRAVEAVNRGRLELTVWAHEFWKVPELTSATKFWEIQHSVKLCLDSRSQLKFSPDTVFKNALYFKEHRTPLLNTVLQLSRHGYVSLHSLYTLDIPCTKIVPTKSKCIKYDLCGMEIKEDQYHTGIGAVCELYYGSLIRDNSQMRLDWASNDFGEPNLPCSFEFMPHCIISRIRPSKKEVRFLGEEYDELVACIVLSFPHKDSTTF